ncbi:unnamed protein product, partial [Mycena citricolor]
ALTAVNRRSSKATEDTPRGLRMLMDIHLDIATLVETSDEYEHDRQLCPDFDEYTEGLSEQQMEELAAVRPLERIYQARKIFRKLMPALERKIVTKVAPDPSLSEKDLEALAQARAMELITLYKVANKAGNNAKSRNVGTATAILAQCLNVDRDCPEIRAVDHSPSTQDKEGRTVCGYAPTLRKKSRHNRGLQHDICGGLLTSIKDDWAVESVRSKIRAFGDKSSSNKNDDSEMPSPDDDEADNKQSDDDDFHFRLFYELCRGDSSNPLKGFLMNRYLVLVRNMPHIYKAIFTGPSLADVENMDPLDCKSNGHGSMATILRMNNQVTPRSIAYVAVLAHFSLTNAVQWKDTYNNVSYIGLYNYIVNFFECPRPDTPHGQHRRKLLAWWTKCVSISSVCSLSDYPLPTGKFFTNAAASSTSHTGGSSCGKPNAGRSIAKMRQCVPEL